MKRLVTVQHCAVWLLSLLPASVYALEVETAQELKFTASLDSLSWNGVGRRSYYSNIPLEECSTVTLTSTEPGEKIAALYIVWAKIPGSWTLDYNGKSETYGQNGYLHEFVPVEGCAEEVSITVQNSETVCFIRAFGSGVLPDDVQIWEPSCEKADILVLPTHSDDEILFFGGVLALYAGQRDLNVQVAYFSKYDHGIREHEKLDGIWTCGVRHYPVSGPFPDVFQGTPDQAEAYYGTEKSMAFYMALLRRFRPQVCIIHDVTGEYGNGTHQFVVRILRQVLEQTADPSACHESAESYGTWDVPKAYLHLWKENPIHLDCRQSLSAFGGKTALEVATEAYKKHVTQQQYWFSVSDEDSYSISDFGLYRTTVGPDTGDDIMEHLIPYAQQEAALVDSTEKEETVPATTATEPAPTQPAATEPTVAETLPEEPLSIREDPLSERLLIPIAAVGGLMILVAVVALCVLTFRKRS